jgi:hypothetical protein
MISPIFSKKIIYLINAGEKGYIIKIQAKLKGYFFDFNLILKYNNYKLKKKS